MNCKSALFLVLIFTQISCLIVKDRTAEDGATLYQQAIEDAMSPDSSEICTTLVPVNKQNPNLIWKTINGDDYLLVVTWKQNISYYKSYLDSAFFNTGSYPIWITTAPELKNKMKNTSARDTNLRLKQLLGLPPNAVYSYFVEFWVKPGDLFRPCPDEAIDDNKCDLCFPATVDPSHVNWINTNRIDRYYTCDLYNKYPWTQLGYTYDWNPKNRSHVGVSEFVIGQNKKIVVKAIYTTQEYLNLTQ